MTYEQKEKLDDLKNLIATYHKVRQDRCEDLQAFEADLMWDASHFWANILQRSKEVLSHKSKEEFEQFVHQYNGTSGNPINPTDLFNKYWLREVLGYVHVASVIDSIILTFKEIRQWKNELEFVCNFYVGQSKRQQLKVPLAEVEIAANQYQTTKGINLDPAGIYFNRWSRKTDDQVEFSPMDIYFLPLLKYWNDFEFLFQWKEYSNDDDQKGFAISKHDFHKIRESFIHFNQIPDIATFETQNAIVSEEHNYRIQFYGIKPSYWLTLQNKIGGYHWELLINDSGFSNDKERVISWLHKNLIGNRWPDHLRYVTATSRTRFLDAALQLLLEQEDLKGCEIEIPKLRFDSPEYRGVEALYVEPKGHFNHFQLDNQNVFELYYSMDLLEEVAQKTYLHEQPARRDLTFLVTTIVRHDDEWVQSPEENSVSKNLPRIFKLIRNGKESPFFIWKVSTAIRYQKPFILSYLFTEPDTCTYALSILDKLEFHSDSTAIHHQCWIKAVDLIFQSLPDFEYNSELYADVYFQLFRQLMSGKYKLPYNRLNMQLESERKQQREDRELSVLNLLENAPLHPRAIYGGQTPLVLPELFTTLAERFIQFEEPALYRNGTIQFPMLKWDALFWLLKTTTNWKMRQHFKAHPKKTGKLVEAFLSQYLESLERKEVTAYDFWEEKETKQVPLWSEKIERLELLDWIYPIYFINERGKLLTFLTPRLDFELTDDRFHKKNSFTAEKLRTHIGVLLQILRKLVLPALPYGFDKEKLLQIKERIEMQIVDYLNQYSKDAPQEGRVDLFSHSKEWQFKQSDKEALLPQIAQAVNWFSKKEEVINALIASGDIVKLLTVLDYITAEGVKGLLIERIRGEDILTFLDQQHWIPEIQTTLAKLSHYPELLPQIEQTISFWKEKVVGKRNTKEYKERRYISELLVSYFKKDEQAINAVEEPEQHHGSISELNYHSYKAFYRGLLYIKNNPEKAVGIFDDLARRYPKYGSIALNRMVAKLNLGALKDDPAIYRDAYDEWIESASAHFTAVDLDSMEPDLSANLMTILLALGEHDEIENRFNKLPLPAKMTESILKIRVNSLIEQKRTAEAMLIVETAKTYHQFSGHTAIGFIKDLEEIVSGVDDVAELSLYCQRIFTNPPVKLVRILPRSFNGKEDIYEFLVKEIVNAADKLLEKIRSINEIKSEDKFNDLVELVLDGRLNSIGMHVGAQSRGAFSDSKNDSKIKQPGERDLPIMDRNKKVWLVCEALIFRGKGTAVSHLQKVFDYYHQKQAFAMLFYDMPTTVDDFNSNWEKYAEEIVPTTDFPVGMEITTSLQDVSSEFDSDRSAIKVGKTIHGNGTIVYHIFVNINYKL